MKKWFILLAIIFAVNYYRNHEDVGKDLKQLQPVQTVLAEQTEGKLRLVADNGCEGIGDTVQEAIADMQKGASGEVFLDTADYLLVRGSALSFLDSLKDALRPSCGVCGLMGTVELAEVADYLSYHIPKLTMAMYEAGERVLPLLISKEGGMQLVQGEDYFGTADSMGLRSDCPDGNPVDFGELLDQCSAGSGLKSYLYFDTMVLGSNTPLEGILAD